MTINKWAITTISLIIFIFTTVSFIRPIILNNSNNLNSILLPSPSAIRYSDSDKVCNDGPSECQSKWCISNKCSSYELTPFNIGDYEAVNIIINKKTYPISSLSTPKELIIFLPDGSSDDQGLDYLKNALCSSNNPKQSKVVCKTQTVHEMKLPVSKLKEQYSGEGAPFYENESVPLETKVWLPELLNRKVKAYTAVGKIFIAPNDWIGHASVGGNGNTVVGFKNADNTSMIEYYEIPGCFSCAYDVANYYFPEAKEVDHMLAPNTLRNVTTNRVSQHIMKYTYPDEKSRQTVYGYAYASIEDKKLNLPVIEVDYRCSESDKQMCELLIDIWRELIPSD